MLWELDVCDVLGLCHPGDAAHQHLVTAAKEGMLMRIHHNPGAFPSNVLTMLQVQLLSRPSLLRKTQPQHLCWPPTGGACTSPWASQLLYTALAV